jgi:hypothetical protein
VAYTAHAIRAAAATAKMAINDERVRLVRGTVPERRAYRVLR